MIAPTGSNRAFHPDGEVAVARAAKTGNHLQILSSGATTSIGLSYFAPKISTVMSIMLTSTSRRGRSWNFKNPSRLARSVTSSSVPMTMYPKFAGGRFFFATGSKSNHVEGFLGI